jgi:hypothetical protein
MVTSTSVAPTRFRRGPVVAAVIVVVVVALGGVAIGADAAFGSAAQQRADCRVVDGATVRADLRRLPVTSGLLTGSVGTAGVSVPWQVVEQRFADQSTEAPQVSMSAAVGLVIIESSVGSQPVRVGMQPDVSPAGELVLSPVELDVAGRSLPVALARNVGGAGDMLQPRTLSGDVAAGPGYRMTSVTAAEDGLEMDVRLPMGALARSGDGQPCV